jgi:hypothetical protein
MTATAGAGAWSSTSTLRNVECGPTPTQALSPQDRSRRGLGSRRRAVACGVLGRLHRPKRTLERMRKRTCTPPRAGRETQSRPPQRSSPLRRVQELVGQRPVKRARWPYVRSFQQHLPRRRNQAMCLRGDCRGCVHGGLRGQEFRASSGHPLRRPQQSLAAPVSLRVGRTIAPPTTSARHPARRWPEAPIIRLSLRNT